MATKEQIEAYKKISNKAWHVFTSLIDRAETESNYQFKTEEERDELARFWCKGVYEKFEPIRDEYYGTDYQKFAEGMIETFLFELERIRGKSNENKIRY